LVSVPESVGSYQLYEQIHKVIQREGVEQILLGLLNSLLWLPADCC
jgi:hypothetical protein